MKLLFVGDVFGKPGRKILLEHLKSVQEKHAIDATIVNGENSAGGFGITKEIATEFLASGIDVLTSGNHIWKQKDIGSFMQENHRLLRPYNMYSGSPGVGCTVITDRKVPFAVINVMGRVFLDDNDCPFRAADKAIEEVREKAKIILVDFHAEATSEKRAMGWYLAGRVSAVLGTHTHIQTADDTVLDGGTAYITDTGMTGPQDSVIGVEKSVIIERFITQMPLRFSAATGDPAIHAVVVDIDDESGRASSIKRLQIRSAEDI